MRVTTPIDIILKDPKGKIFEEGNLRAGQINASTWAIEDDILKFKARYGIVKKDPNTQKDVKKIKEESVEILLDEILFLAVRGAVVFPINEEEEEDVTF